MKRNWGLIAALLTLSSPLTANDDASLYYSDEYFTITDVKTTDITELDTAVENAFKEEEFENFVDPLTEAEVILDRVIAIGDKIWKIIEKNQPVVNQTYQSTSVVPQGATRWEQLQGWQMPQTRVYKTQYTNGFGMNVVDFSYRIAFTHGGNVNGKGQYLARVEIEPAEVNVAWGYKFNASGEILNVTNAGTTRKPIAALELRVNWQVNTVMRHMQESDRFYIRGDGLFKNLSDGNMPAE